MEELYTCNAYIFNQFSQYKKGSWELIMHLLEDNISINLGTLIAATRQERGLTQDELAKGICSIPYLSKLENDKIEPNQEIVSLLLQRLGFSVDQLIQEQQQLNVDILKWYQAILERDDANIESYHDHLTKSTKNIQNISLIHNFKLAKLRYSLYKQDAIAAKELIKYFTKLKSKLTLSQSLYFYCFYGIYYCIINQHEKGIESFKEAEKISQRLRYEEPELIYFLALTYSHLYNSSVAIVYGFRALDLLNNSSQFLRSIDCQLIIATNLYRIGQYDQAEQYLQNTLKIAHSLKLDHVRTIAYHNLGNLYVKRGELEKALGYYQESLAINDPKADSSFYTTYCIGEIYIELGQIEKAKDLIGHAMNKLSLLNPKSSLLLKLELLKLEILGNDQQIEQFLEHKSLPLFREKSDWRYLIDCYEKLAKINAKNFLYKKSSHYFQLANDTRKKIMY